MELLLALGASVAGSTLVAALFAILGSDNRWLARKTQTETERRVRARQEYRRKVESFGITFVEVKGTDTEVLVDEHGRLHGHTKSRSATQAMRDRMRNSEVIARWLSAEIRQIGIEELRDAIADGANDPDLTADAWLRKNRWDVALVRLRSAARWLRLRIPGRRISK